MVLLSPVSRRIFVNRRILVDKINYYQNRKTEHLVINPLQFIYIYIYPNFSPLSLLHLHFHFTFFKRSISLLHVVAKSIFLFFFSFLFRKQKKSVTSQYRRRPIRAWQWARGQKQRFATAPAESNWLKPIQVEYRCHSWLELADGFNWTESTRKSETKQRVGSRAREGGEEEGKEIHGEAIVTMIFFLFFRSWTPVVC